jgi:hypothetical protein
MRCEQAAEFISALYDGIRIPREAAEHVGMCQTCRVRLAEYAEMGAELRRMASLEPAADLPAVSWQKQEKSRAAWWQKGWGTIRIPKIAFASMLLLILALGSGFAMLKARTLTPGKALVLTIKYPQNSSMRCALSIGGEKSPVCGFMMNANPGIVGVFFRIITTDGERFELGVRSKVAPTASSVSKELENLPDAPYWFEPGEKLEIAIAGLGPLTVTGEVLDHMPSILTSNSSNAGLDPEEGELRVISPALLRGKELVFDLEGASATYRADYCVFLYSPGRGRYLLSLSPVAGAVEGEIKQSRIHFEMDGESYVLLTGAPIARNDHIWILHQPDYRPSHEPGASADSDEGTILGGADLSRILANRPAKN